MKPKTNRSIQLLFLTFLFLGAFQASAQIINNLGIASDGWDKACAGNNGNFNQYFAKASFDGASNPGNEWILELSDANGDFSDPIELARETDDDVVQDPGFEFAIPTDAEGEGYKLRVRSTDPAEMAESEESYALYYMDFVTNLTITHDGTMTEQSPILSAGPITLSVVTFPDPDIYQYQWYRNSTLIVGESGSSLNVTESGMYFAQIDYGSCSDNGTTFSNMPDVCIGSTGGGTTIDPPSKTALCPGETETLTVSTSIPSPTYQWIKDGTEISGATGATYSVDGSAPDFAGDYQVLVSDTNSCPEVSPAVTFTNADDFMVTRVNGSPLVLLPGGTETLSVTTTASGTPTYQWFRNGLALSGATAPDYDATQEGTYYCEVTQPAGTCPSPTTKNSETTQVITPNDFELLIDHVSPYTDCGQSSIALEVATINAVMSDASRIDVTSDLRSSFTYQWKRNGTNVGGATSETISLTDTSENGTYEVEGMLNTYNASSNQLPALLSPSGALTITSTSTVHCNSNDTITISTTSDLSGESFEWRQDGTAINTTETSLAVTEPGTYRLVLERNGCSLQSNEIVIAPLDPDLITLDPDGTIVFPEGTTRTVTASGGTAYRWFDANNVELGDTNSITLDTEGSYILVANIDNCEITRQLTVEYLENFKIPNVITPNGDGFNDQWVLPNSYSNKSDVTVIVYRENGEELMNLQSYKNDWPDASMTFPQQNMVFYYTIKNANETLKQGTITVIR